MKWINYLTNRIEITIPDLIPFMKKTCKSIICLQKEQIYLFNNSKWHVKNTKKKRLAIDLVVRVQTGLYTNKCFILTEVQEILFVTSHQHNCPPYSLLEPPLGCNIVNKSHSPHKDKQIFAKKTSPSNISLLRTQILHGLERTCILVASLHTLHRMIAQLNVGQFWWPIIKLKWLMLETPIAK